MAAAAEALTRRPALAEPRSSKILRVLAKSPVQFALVVLGLLWLVPTFGLLLTSLLSPVDFQVKGWWQVFSMPHKLTWSNYDAIFHNSTILHSLLTTAEIAVGATLLPIFIGALAAYAFAWLPITVAIFSQLRTFGSNIDIIAPATFVSLVIPLAVFFAFQRYFVQGLLAGSVK
jgi:ABC-type glycerol-3-phosphate transport system permease component